MSLLKEIGLVKNENKSSFRFESLFSGTRFDKIPYKNPHEYVTMYYDEYCNKYKDSDVSLNGKIFELIIATLFLREGLFPIYMQAKVAFVPNADYDLVMYSMAENPYAFSLKTSLRERYKQADLEAIALKYVHRRAKCYLITMSKSEAGNVKKKIQSGDVIGLDEVIVASEPEFDNLIKTLKSEKFKEAGTKEIITSQMKVTKGDYEKLIKK